MNTITNTNTKDTAVQQLNGHHDNLMHLTGVPYQIKHSKEKLALVLEWAMEHHCHSTHKLLQINVSSLQDMAVQVK